jgi:hypothetical protein
MNKTLAALAALLTFAGIVAAANAKRIADTVLMPGEDIYVQCAQRAELRVEDALGDERVRIACGPARMESPIESPIASPLPAPTALLSAPPPPTPITDELLVPIGDPRSTPKGPGWRR